MSEIETAKSTKSEQWAMSIVLGLILGLATLVDVLFLLQELLDRFSPSKDIWINEATLPGFFNVRPAEVVLASFVFLWLLFTLFVWWIGENPRRWKITSLVWCACMLWPLWAGPLLGKRWPDVGTPLRQELRQKKEAERQQVVQVVTSVRATKPLVYDHVPAMCVETSIPITWSEAYELLPGLPVHVPNSRVTLQVSRYIEGSSTSNSEKYCPSYKQGQTWLVRYEWKF